MAPEMMEVLAARIKDETGFDVLCFKPRLLGRRVAARLRARECKALGEYLELLEVDPGEKRKLIRSLSIHVSSFFRNPQTYRLLQERVLPEILAGKSEVPVPLLIVSAGCAAGEEPYSLAMLLLRHFRREIDPARVKIVGLDMDREILEEARRGVYEPERLRGLPSEYKRRFFKGGPSEVRLKGEILSMVEFFQHDLRDGLPLSGVDLVVCRNMLIYFTRESQQGMVRGFYRALAPGGYLVLGRTETLIGQLRSGFRTVDMSEHVYQKAGEEPCGWR